MHLSGTYWDPFRVQQCEKNQVDLSLSEMEARVGQLLSNECPFQSASEGSPLIEDVDCAGYENENFRVQFIYVNIFFGSK